MQCPTCGFDNKDGSVFCANCGGPMATAPASASPPAPAPAPYPQQPPMPAYTPGVMPPAYYPPTAPRNGAGNLLFMRPVLDYISRGGIFRLTVAWWLRILAGIMGLVLVVLVFATLRATFQMTGVAILGGLIWTAVTIVAAYMLVHTYLIRAQTVMELPETRYSVVPIVAVLIRLSGELGAIYLVYLGVSAFIGGMFAEGMSYGVGNFYGTPFSSLMYGVLPTGTGFISGVVAFLGMAVVAFVQLIVCYMLAELAVVLVDIAENTARTAEAAKS